MSGSDAMRLRNVAIAFSESSRPFVHVDVEDLRAVLDLLARDGERSRVVVRLDQLAELGRARDVRALADVDERLRCIGGGHCSYSPVHEWLEAGEAQLWLVLRQLARFVSLAWLGDLRDVLGRRAAAAADDVEQPVLGPRLRSGRPCRAGPRRTRPWRSGRPAFG